MKNYGLIRVAACSPQVSVGNPKANVDAMKELMAYDADIYCFPELGLTGYTCRDLFMQSHLLDQAEAAMLHAARLEPTKIVIVGVPFRVGNSLYNCAAVLCQGKCIGLVPKQHIPTYGEFEEFRWFTPADGSEPKVAKWMGEGGREYDVPFGIDLLFNCRDFTFGIEICEDGWMPIPPSSHQAIAGATILFNLSASNEIVGKGDYRGDVVVAGQSGRCIAAYVYACAGPSESTTDLVMAGDCIIAENGSILERRRLDAKQAVVVADIDVERLMQERRRTSFSKLRSDRTYRSIPCSTGGFMPVKLLRPNPGTPFVPRNNAQLKERCETIFAIQSLGLAKRLQQLPPKTPVYLGLSGGLDSTLAMLVGVETYDRVLQKDRMLRPITMPGFGTTEKTLRNAQRLAQFFELPLTTIDIRETCLQIFRDQGYCPFGIDCRGMDVGTFEKMLRELPPEKRKDLGFENVQARVRTLELFARGFVLGTGDLSELALGWCTYNGDHMSNYNVNCSIPKTLVKFLVQWVAENRYNGTPRPGAYDVLMDVVGTVISPELLPPAADGSIAQSTEELLGPYILHDYFLYHFVRNGFSPAKIFWMATECPDFKNIKTETIRATLGMFIHRFFGNQFKRSAVPDGPKVGTVSLSPRGDWRMPSDADPYIWENP